MSKSSGLTAYLLDPSNNPSTATLLAKATTHPFLAHAGKGTLPAKTLLKWLAQDVHYTRAYVRFLGHMLTRLRLPTSIRTGDASTQTALEFRVFNLLVGALTNIQREMQFFEDSCKEYGLELDAEVTPVPVTKAFADMFGSVVDRGLLQGLVVLWTTEMCYLTAWRFARDQQDVGIGTGETQDGQEAQARRLLKEKFIPNWTCREFEEFVDECRDVVDEVAKEEGSSSVLADQMNSADESSSKKARRLVKDCEDVFNHVIWLESGFWPAIEHQS